MSTTLCVSLGGSRIEVGVYRDELGFVGDAPVDWRANYNTTSSGREALCAGDLGQVIANRAGSLFRAIRADGGHLDVGIAFPGPQVSGRWYSNNLTDDFKDDGVRIEEVVHGALAARPDVPPPRRVRAVLDAQADAGGELFHPAGALRHLGRGEGAVVINVATGIAAGFAVRGGEDDELPRILQTEEEFCSWTGGRFDAGSGQLGRHLFVNSDHSWSYRYAPRGAIPTDMSGVRLTNYLSGPALAARLTVALLTKAKAEVRENDQIRALLDRAREAMQGADPATAWLHVLDHIRAGSASVSAQLLAWADRELLNNVATDPVRAVLRKFRRDSAIELGSAIACWQSVPGWEHFGRHIVLTGGVGQRLFLRSNGEFLRELRERLRSETAVCRSTLADGCERAAWFFHRAVFAQNMTKDESGNP